MLFQGVFGNIDSPFPVIAPGTGLATAGTQGQGLILLLNSVFKFMVVAAGIYAFFNLLTAGYMFMTAGGDPKNIAAAWQRIWQTLLGLLIVAGSYLLAMIVGILVFGSPSAITSPVIYQP